MRKSSPYLGISVLISSLTGLTGCLPGPGPCDEASALELVYDEQGAPAFAGQAVMNQSCGAGGFCHAAEVLDPAFRFGAPDGLGFDVTLASTTPDGNDEAVERLEAHQLRILAMSGEILAQIEAGQMTPRGAAGRMYRDQVTAYSRVGDDGTTFTDLPGAHEPEGLAILRNWLACGAPLVERTVPRADLLGSTIGIVQPVCERQCVDLTWPSIHETILVPTCARSSCHDESEPAAGLDLVGGGLDGVLARLLTDAPMGAQCRAGATPMVTPSDTAESLLYLKVAAASSDDVCGSRMPLSGNPLSEQRLCAMRVWIECGACAEADGGDCASCIEMRRSECEVQLVGGEVECTNPTACPNQGSF